MKKILFIMILVMFSPLGLAAHVKLFQVELSVPSQSEQDRTKAIKQGMTQVLTRLMGEGVSKNQPSLKAMLNKPEQYVQEFSYVPVADQSSRYRLHIRYDKDQINALLKKSNTAYWGDNRPLIMVWMIVTNKQGDTAIIGDETPGEVLNRTKSLGETLGLPLVFPAMDVTDVSAVAIDDIKNINLPVLKSVSHRYAPDAFLVGIVQQGEQSDTSHWYLLVNDKRWDWPVTDTLSGELLSTALTHVSELLTKYYVNLPTDSSTHWLTMNVTNVTAADDLTRLTAHLKQLVSVKEVQLETVEGSSVEIALLVRGSLDVFQQNVSIGGHLTAVSLDEGETAPKNTLYYEWLR